MDFSRGSTAALEQLFGARTKAELELKVNN